MYIEKLSLKTGAVMPLMAAFPYRVTLDSASGEDFSYDPATQLTRFAGSGFSTSRYDESAGGIFQSKSDTKKDD